MLVLPPLASEADPGIAAMRHTRLLLAAAQAVTAHYPQPPRLYVITHGGQAVAGANRVDLSHTAVRGVLRVLAHEHPELRATLIDTDPEQPTPDALVDELLGAAPDDEVALWAGTRQVARLAYAPLSSTERTAATVRPVRYGVDRFRLRAGRLGEPDRLELAITAPVAPGPGEVEIQVQAAGLNFRDVLTVMGLLPGGDDLKYRIGLECAGVVHAVGPDVTHVSPGDRVLALDLRGGSFASFATVPAVFVVPISAGLDFATAAGLPVGFATAWYALRHVARLAPGERILIHSATGGTGLAAVRVARLLGAEVLATAGSEEKRRYLRELGIEHVMDSRSLDFAAQTRAATAGRVDVVLNSLAGPAIRAGLETLRPFGRFVELGVRDIISDTALGLAPLRHNISLSTVDLTELQERQPDLLAEVLREVLAEIASGKLSALPQRTYPLALAPSAFRDMAAAEHLGKLVLTMPEQGKTTAVRSDPVPVRSDGGYIITGGLRGVGLATARWLAEHGANHLVLNGRTPPERRTERVLDELRRGGTRVTVVLGDVAEPDIAERLVTVANAGGSVLRGVVHSAMVLDDAALAGITDAQLDRVWAPKVTGAWRLHEACADRSAPDWFVLYSSMASLFGNAGQGVYAAANAWLDGFATWRNARGLPTLAVNWGPWGQTGVATNFADRGYQTIPTSSGLHALGALLTHHRVRTGVVPGEPETWLSSNARQSPLFELLDIGTEQDQNESVDSPDIRGHLEALEPGLGRRTALEEYLTGHIRAVLRLGAATLDPQTPLRALGFDSLLSLELRTRLEGGLRVKLPGNFVWKHPTLAELATGLAEYMDLDLFGPKRSDG